MQKQEWNPVTFAVIGAVIGAIVAAVQGDPSVVSAAQGDQVAGAHFTGQVIGGALGGAALFAIVAVIRNRAGR